METVPFAEMDLRTTATASLATSKSSIHRMEANDLEERFCFTCRRPVHPYRRIALPDKVFHPDCAKCYRCQIDLSLSNYRDFEGKLYCPPHFAQARAEFIEHRQKSIGSNTQRSSMTTLPNRSSEVNSPVLVNTQAWPSNYQGSAPSDEASPRTIYVDRSLRQQTDENVSVLSNTLVDSPRVPPRPRLVTSIYSEPVSAKSILTHNGPPQNTGKCFVCSKSLLPTTYINLSGKSIHTDCLRCQVCGTRLKQSTLNELDGKIYCPSDYAKLIEKKAQTTQYETVKLKSMPSSPLSARRIIADKTVCFSCGKKVYATESLYVMERVYHKSCFKCMKCNGTLSVENYHVLNGQPYCKSHYRELMYNAGECNGSQNLNVENGLDWTDRSSTLIFAGTEPNRAQTYIIQSEIPVISQYETPLNLINFEPVACQICQKIVQPRDGIHIAQQYYHYDCFTCTHCKKKLNIGRFEMVKGKAYCSEDFLKLFGRNRSTSTRQSLMHLNEVVPNRPLNMQRSYSFRNSRALISG